MTENEHDDHPKLGFIRSYIFSTDHKVIAKQYLFLGIVFLLIAGGFAVLIRMKLGDPASKISLDWYNVLFTNHGGIMVFYAITPIVFGAFGNFIIPLQIGARDMAFPVLNMVSFWVQFLGGVVIILSFVVPEGSASAGWTMYAPLASTEQLTTPILGWGQSLWVLGIALAGTAVNGVSQLHCHCV